ncbi:helix-turn-helix domain-containing protein [Streptomyces sp. NPDC058155]|uniref:AraC-like ligand-binding domain-containing protein n=1 Tax=Streptomyces sp. NPDC058155 TaxID=3346359 RepID=UPI0036E3B45C
MLEDASGQGATAAGPVVTVDASSIPAADRFGWWSDMVGHEVMAVSIRSPHSARFQGRVEVVDLPHGQVSTFSNSPMTAHRSPVQIRRQDPEEYFLILVRGSSIRLEQGRGVACLDVGDMALFSTSHPLVCEFHDRDQPVRVTLLRLPRAVLPQTGGGADRLLAESLPARTGSAALLGPYLAGLPEAARTCAPPELARLGAIGVDLATSFLVTRLGARDTLPVETRKTVLLARINAFIDHRIADPQLRPAAIAAHHHISVRTLHLLFRSEPEPVAASIRRRRLEHCHADLADPALRHRTIGETAARWGFRHAADFSRAFRSAYGASPSEVRARALDAKDACAPR